VSQHVDGLRIWMLQRISALYLAAYLIGVTGWFWLHPVTGYDGWRSWFTHPLATTGSAGFLLALLVHGWVGLRDVILDYVHSLGLRLVLLTLIAFLLIGCGFWGMRILVLASTAA
jgi:succinate dehydrogenase / fumarate reductase membrane anchor subunit